MEARVPGEPGWAEGEGRGRNAESWLPPQTPDPGLSSGRPVGSQPHGSPEPAAWQHRGHGRGKGILSGEPVRQTVQVSLLSLLTGLCSYPRMLTLSPQRCGQKEDRHAPPIHQHLHLPLTPAPGWTTLALLEDPSIQPHSHDPPPFTLTCPPLLTSERKNKSPFWLQGTQVSCPPAWTLDRPKSHSQTQKRPPLPRYPLSPVPGTCRPPA